MTLIPGAFEKELLHRLFRKIGCPVQFCCIYSTFLFKFLVEIHVRSNLSIFDHPIKCQYTVPDRVIISSTNDQIPLGDKKSFKQWAA